MLKPKTPNKMFAPPRDQPNCLVGADCGHAILTMKIGVYRCPFGNACFKKLENQKRGGFLGG